jgi:hypothetical protein
MRRTLGFLLTPTISNLMIHHGTEQKEVDCPFCCFGWRHYLPEIRASWFGDWTLWWQMRKLTYSTASKIWQSIGTSFLATNFQYDEELGGFQVENDQ